MTAAPSPKSRPLSLAKKAMGAQIQGKTSLAGLRFSGAATDSRAVTPGRLFFALPGERVDGFDFCADAAKAGASAVVVQAERGKPSGCKDIPVLRVADPRKALGDLAATIRDEFKGKVVGITGSNGKTTTKELCAAALSAGGAVLRTRGNFNTDVGMPLTILEANGDEAFWVLEMAMRGLGEIAYLAAIAKPHIGVVTNVAGAHLERLGSLEGVAKAKGEIFHGLANRGIAIFPSGDLLIENQAAHLPEDRKWRFSVPGSRRLPAVVRSLEFLPAGQEGMVVRLSIANEPVVVRLPFAGEHNVKNAAAAMTVAAALGLSPVAAASAMEHATLPPHRAHLRPLAGRIVVDDCYNANPASMQAALHALVLSAGAPERSFAILGDMLELGPDSAVLHGEIGRLVARLGLAGLCTVGPLAMAIAEAAKDAGMPVERIFRTTAPEDAARALAPVLRPADFVLVKASRGMRLERVVEALAKEIVP